MKGCGLSSPSPSGLMGNAVGTSGLLGETLLKKETDMWDKLLRKYRNTSQLKNSEGWGKSCASDTNVNVTRVFYKEVNSCAIFLEKEKRIHRFRYVENKFNLHCGEKQTDDIRQFKWLINFSTGTCFESKQLLTVLQSNQKSYQLCICHIQFVIQHFFKWIKETRGWKCSV